MYSILINEQTYTYFKYSYQNLYATFTYYSDNYNEKYTQDFSTYNIYSFVFIIIKFIEI